MAHTLVPAPRESSSRGIVLRTLSSGAYLFMAWPIQLAVFTVNVTLLSLAMTVFLAPIMLPLAVVVAGGAARLELWFVSRLVQLPVSIPDPVLRLPHETGPEFALRLARSPKVWLDLAWSMIAWLVSTVTWSIGVVWWTMALAEVTWPLYGWALHTWADNVGPAGALGIDSFAGSLMMNLVLAVFFVATLPLVSIGLARLQGLFATSMLCRVQQEEQIKELTQSRDAARVAEAAQLSRLERDIHDGPQQRLVRLKMDLARMERQLGDDSHAVMGLRAAIASTQETLDELRALSKGIAPPVLADRGLTAAVREAAARSIVPVSVEADLGEVAALPPHLEQAAYFVVTEALTNVAKHSGAEQALVSIRAVGQDLLVSVTDDGRGGAHPSKGQGIHGLQNRVRSVGGTLSVESPVGGPTIIAAAFPLN